jgi:hypothetical protein
VKAVSAALVIILIVSVAPPSAFAQSESDGAAWRMLAEKLEGGAAVDMRLRDGRHFKATFIGAREQTMVVQRKTRVPVAVEEVPYEAIASMSRVAPASMSGGKIAAIALGSAGAAIGVLYLIALAAFD